MTRYDQDWIDGVAGAGGGIGDLDEPLRFLFVVTDTTDGKAAFYVCKDFACQAPATDAASLGQALAQ